MVSVQDAIHQCLNAEDMKLFIEGLSNVFYAILCKANTPCNEEATERYNTGISLCNQYLYGILNSDEFCEKMNEAGLKTFLYGVNKFLQQELIEKYELDDQIMYKYDCNIINP